MKELIITALILCFIGCRTVVEKNLSTTEGVIAAYFNLPENEVAHLKEKGLEDSLIIKLLIISSGSHLTTEEILKMKDEGKTLENIAGEVGIEPAILNDKTNKILKDIKHPKP